MRVKIGGCRMPIGMCSEYRDKDCGKFCYYNTVDIKTKADRIRAMTDDEMAEWIAGDVFNLTGGAFTMVMEACLDWLKEEAGEENGKT